MTTEDLTCLAPTRLPAGALAPTADPIGLLIRAYRQAGLSIEAARLCAVADFDCCFPQYLTGGV